MGQSKFHSKVEVCVSVAIGYVVAVASQMVIWPYFGIEVSFGQNLYMACYFTVVGLIRSYYVRRMFNALHTKGILNERVSQG